MPSIEGKKCKRKERRSTLCVRYQADTGERGRSFHTVVLISHTSTFRSSIHILKVFPYCEKDSQTTNPFSFFCFRTAASCRSKLFPVTSFLTCCCFGPGTFLLASCGLPSSAPSCQHPSHQPSSSQCRRRNCAYMYEVREDDNLHCQMVLIRGTDNCSENK